MKVFWSWQSDRDQKLHHYFVRDALKEACRLIADEVDYSEASRPDVDHDTKGTPGTPDITATILEKIASANVFVADVTPVGITDPATLQPNVPPARRSEPKYLQNPNVMSELGYAERALGQSRIVLVANSAHYPGPQALPFDWRHRSGAKVYNLPDGATKAEIKAEEEKFAAVLKTHLKPILGAQTPAEALSPPIIWQEPSENDLTIWKGGEEKLPFRDSQLGTRLQNAQLAVGARIFAKIAPSTWCDPGRARLEQAILSVGLNIRGRDCHSGVNENGALCAWGRGNQKPGEIIVSNATQWFCQNGEIWGVSSDCFGADVDDTDGRSYFACTVPFTPIDGFLIAGVNAVKAMGGQGPIGVKLGGGNLLGTYFPRRWGKGGNDAVKPCVTIEQKSGTWSQLERRELLFQFWNALLDAYGLTLAANMADFERVADLPPLPT